MKRFKFVSSLFTIVCVMGCAKKAPDENQSRVVLQMPQKMALSSMSGSSCFAVNIKAPDLIKSKGGICDPAYGDFAGLASAGSQLELNTVSGKDRTIEIFFIQSNTACQSGFDPNKGLSKTFGSNRVYRIAQKTGVALSPGEQTIEIEIQWPEKSNSFAQLFTFPSTCQKENSSSSTGSMASIVQGEYRGTTDLGSKVHIRIRDQKLNFQNNGWGTKLRPLRLGVKND